MTSAKTTDAAREQSPRTASTSARRRWIAALASAPGSRLASLWQAIATRPAYETLRAPEIGLIMVRGRAGGTGNRFNLGEATVTRCAVRLESGETGVAYRTGRDKRAAEIAAVADAMLQSSAWCDVVANEVVAPLLDEQRAARERTARRAAATKVEFFTLSRHRPQK